MKNYFLLLLVCCSLGQLVAQPLAGSSTYEKLIEAAELAESQMNWSAALDKYKEAYEKEEDDALVPMIARLNYDLRDYNTAQREYNRVFRKMEPTDSTFNLHRFYYGRSLKIMGEYDDAIMVFQDFLRHTTDKDLKTLAELEITGAELAQNTNMETSEVKVESAGRQVNGSFSEYSPALSQDGKVLYYSTWDVNEVVIPEDLNDPKNFSRIFMSEQKEGRKGEKEWGKPEVLSEEVNRPGAHTANPAISSDGRRMYYNRIEFTGNVATKSELYVSDVEDTGWKSGNPVTSLNGDYLILQPAMGELFGGEVIFFTSDMAGGFGGLDVYYAPYEGGEFGDAVNLGPTINTVGDDMTPFYFDGTLYFASTGYATFGGSDIFYSVWNGSNWSTPENMGPGFNTSQDDQSFRLYGDGFVGFLTSNRLGGRSVKSKTCCDDIYGFQIARIYADLAAGLFTEDRKGLIGGSVRLVSKNGGGSGELKQNEDGNAFSFGLDLENEYYVIADHPKYYPDTAEINTVGLLETKNFEERFFLKARPVPPPKPVYDTLALEKVIVLENLLYDFNKANIRPDAEQDLIILKSFMDTFPEMVIELGSHTDARGSASSNLSLSKRRADSARRWLMQKGVAPNRIKTQGYGKTVPQTVNDRLVELYDWLPLGQVLAEDYINSLPNEEQQEIAHQLNRRTEFKILEGPTSFVYKREIFERTEEQKERKAMPQQGVPTKEKSTSPKSTATPAKSATPEKSGYRELKPKSQAVPAAKAPANDTLKISQLSSLYGQKDISGLPILEFEHRKYNLGPVKKGQKRAFSYTFTNKGKAPAQVMLIQACECTTTEHNNSKIYQPGESGTIEVIFDSTEKDESETITIDIFLEQVDKKDTPILEMVEYEFKLIK